MARLRFTSPAAVAGLTAAMLLLGIVPAGDARAAEAPAPGRWSIAPVRSEAARVTLRLEYDGANSTGEVKWVSAWSSTVPLADAGIPSERLQAPLGPVAFRIVREPGTFDCTGSAGGGSASGQFRYAPSPGFDDALAARGLGRPTYRQSLALAAEGTTLAFVDRIRASSQRASVAETVRIVEQGVTPGYVADMESLGYHIESIAQLERMRVAGVTPDLVRALRGAGFGDLSAPQLLRLAQHGVDPRYITGMQAHGVTTTSTDELVRLHDHGVTLRYVAGLAAAGYPGLSVDELLALRDHDVSAAFIAQLKAHGDATPSVRDLIRLRQAAGRI